MSPLRSVFVFVLVLISKFANAEKREVFFNEPELTGVSSAALEEKLVEYLRLATPGSEAYLSIFTLALPHVAEEIVQASQRGVTTGIIIRPRKKIELAKASMSILEGSKELKECPWGNCIKKCSLGGLGINACGSRIYNHNKFYAFSELSDGRKNVILQSSSNLHEGQRQHYNDMLVISDNEALYQAYKNYWHAMRRKKAHFAGPTVEISPDLKMHVFPMKKDPIENTLKKVKCDADSRIRVVHSRFTKKRLGVAKELVRLSQEGCDVKVISRNDVSVNKPLYPDSPSEEIIDELAGLMYILPYKEDVDGQRWKKGDPRRNALHSKVILIDAPMGPSNERQQWVLTGSHNLDGASLNLNNEIMLEIADKELHRTYSQSWQRLYEKYLEYQRDENKITLVISDVDDTIKVSQSGFGGKEKLDYAWFELSRFIGMSELYQKVLKENPGTQFVYLSNAPSWLNIGNKKKPGRITGFLHKGQFPEGEERLRPNPLDKQYKRRHLIRILQTRRPGKVLLVGDNGEKDIKYYANIARDFSEHGIDFTQLIHVLYDKDETLNLRRGQVGFVSSLEASLELTRQGWLSPSASQNHINEFLPSLLKEEIGNEKMDAPHFFPYWINCSRFEWVWGASGVELKIKSKLDQICK